MPILKCKMCGGDLEITEGTTVCECEFCGTKQTVPSVDNEKKVNLFLRANRLRAACEFDKAAGVYESIITDFPEEAEAYWGLILCKYGIEYVDDPATGKKIPTCHRSSYECVLDDPNFDLVMENSDSVARGVYREEAKIIENIRSKIVEISSKEDPYDIFICYKETDEHGDRTIDSLIAQDTYDALTSKGYKVFFSRITLEDKLGQEYEPYIFAALNSAKIMLAFGTSYEYYNAVWVKNEWSRYLDLMNKGEKKTLIPCYKDIDAYDMPKEFKRLQAQDMGKVGAIQDLLRGIDKILGRTTPIATQNSTPINNEETASLKRAQLYLEEGNWEKVNEYCEKVLDKNPENSLAYFLKELAEKKCTSYQELALKNYPEGTSLTYARKFANFETAKLLADFDNAKANKEQLLKDIRKTRQNDPIAQEKRAKLKKVRDTADFAESRMYTTSYATYALDPTGTLKGTEIPDDKYGIYDGVNAEVKTWKDIVKVFFDKNENTIKDVIGIALDGSIHVTEHKKETGRLAKFENDLSELRTWKNISKLFIKEGLVFGLKNDGTVICGGTSSFKNLPTFSEFNGITDTSHLTDIVDFLGRGWRRYYFLKKDGTIASTGTYNGKEEPWDEISKWSDIKKIFHIYGRTVGMKTDGSLIATKYSRDGEDKSFWNEISNWSDLVDIIGTDKGVLAINEYGDLLTAGIPGFDSSLSVIDKLSTWKDIAKFYIKVGKIYGLTIDGTLKYVQTSNKQDFDTSTLKDATNIVGFVPNFFHDVAITDDGTLIASGKNDHGQCNVSNLRMAYGSFDMLQKSLDQKKAKAKAYSEYANPLKEKLESELSQFIEQTKAKYDSIRASIPNEMNQAIDANEKKRKEYEGQKRQLNERFSKLGIFKIKEKNEITAQISEINSAIANLESEQTIRNRYKTKINEASFQEDLDLKNGEKNIRAKYPIISFEEYIAKN